MPLSSARPKKKDPMNMKIPNNPRYQHIKSALDTGASMSKYMARIEDIRQNYRYRKDEIFKRMKMSTFVQLVIKVAEYNNVQDVERDLPNIPLTPSTMTQDRGGSNPSPPASIALTEGDFGCESVMGTARSTFEGVSQGIGEMDINTPMPPPDQEIQSDPNHESPYLLLDVRDHDCFNQCHIISAINFPIAMLSRSVNSEIKELITYKNKEGKIILLYDEDERIAIRAATTLAERGYDNLFLLSGGLKVASKNFTDGFITGTLPSFPKQGKVGHTITMATKHSFSQDDIEKLELLLDNALADRSVGESLADGDTSPAKNACSRLSKASTASSRMSTASLTSTRTYPSDFSPLRPPFRP